MMADLRVFYAMLDGKSQKQRLLDRAKAEDEWQERFFRAYVESARHG